MKVVSAADVAAEAKALKSTKLNVEV